MRFEKHKIVFVPPAFWLRRFIDLLSFPFFPLSLFLSLSLSVVRMLSLFFLHGNSSETGATPVVDLFFCMAGLCCFLFQFTLYMMLVILYYPFCLTVAKVLSGWKICSHILPIAQNFRFNGISMIQ